MQKLLYIKDNTFVPTYRVTSSARLGQKWYQQADIGDVLDLTVTETDESFGKAVVVEKEVMSYREVLENASHNHVAFSDKVNETNTATSVLDSELRAAYGYKFDLESVFTVLHILRLNQDVVEASEDGETDPNPIDHLAELAELADVGVAALEITNYAEVGTLRSEQTVRYEF